MVLPCLVCRRDLRERDRAQWSPCSDGNWSLDTLASLFNPDMNGINVNPSNTSKDSRTRNPDSSIHLGLRTVQPSYFLPGITSPPSAETLTTSRSSRVSKLTYLHTEFVKRCLPRFPGQLVFQLRRSGPTFLSPLPSRNVLTNGNLLRQTLYANTHLPARRISGYPLPYRSFCFCLHLICPLGNAFIRTRR